MNNAGLKAENTPYWVDAVSLSKTEKTATDHLKNKTSNLCQTVQDELILQY